jgi:two-component system, OmpR family, response regulator
MARILVVDENPVERRILRLTLQGDGHSVAEASDGSQALEVISKVSCDLVLVAMDMREMDGYTMITQAHAIPERDQMQFIAVLEAIDDKGPVESFIAGASDLLIRPFGAPEVRQAIDRALATETIDLREKLVGIQLEAYETAIRLQESARSE